MGIQGRSLHQAGLGGEVILKTQALRSSLTRALHQKTRAGPELVSIPWEDRETFRAHLHRLDDQTRRERFGGFASAEGFFERYVRNINFANTLLLGVFCDGILRASAELRSLHSCWANEAELAIIVERDWQGQGLRTLLFRGAVSLAQELGITELFISCNLEKERSVSFLRLLGNELRSTTPLRLTAFDLLASRDEDSGATDGLIRLGLPGMKMLTSGEGR